MVKYYAWELIYQCSNCEFIQNKSSHGICRRCGNYTLKEKVGRWVITATFWKRSGHWEIKKEEDKQSETTEIKEWLDMFKDGLNHLNNGITWDISPNSQVHKFLRDKFAKQTLH